MAGALSCASSATTPPATQSSSSRAVDDEGEVSSEAYRAVLEAELELQEGNVPGGIARLREAVLHDPTSSYLRVRLAEAYLEAGDTAQARAAGEEALAVAPNQVAALRVVARAWSAAGNPTKARRGYERALLAAPADRETSSLLAELLVEQGHFKEAEAVIEKLMTNEPGAVDGYLSLARIFASRGDIERALVHVGRALAREGADPEALGLKLTLLWSEGRFAEALPAARALASVAGAEPVVRRDLMSALALAGATDDAEVLAAAWLDEDGAEATRVAVAEGWERAGELRRAVAVLELAASSKGASTAPGGRGISPRCAAEAARLLLQLREVGRATEIVCPLVDAAASPAVAAFALTTCTRALVQAGRAKEAGALILKRAGKLGVSLGESPSAMVDGLTTVARAGGLDRERALSLADQALAVDAAGPNVISAVAHAHEELGDVAGARKILDDALRARPSSPELLFALARHLDRQRQTLPAVEIVERLMDRGRTGVEELNFAAFALADAGVRLDEAPRLAWRALVQDPLNGYVVDTLGWALLQQGDVEGAVRTLQRADRLSPGEGEVLFHLASAMEKKGDVRAMDIAQRAQALLEVDDPLRVRVAALLGRLARANGGK